MTIKKKNERFELSVFTILFRRRKNIAAVVNIYKFYFFFLPNFDKSDRVLQWNRDFFFPRFSVTNQHANGENVRFGPRRSAGETRTGTTELTPPPPPPRRLARETRRPMSVARTRTHPRRLTTLIRWPWPTATTTVSHPTTDRRSAHPSHTVRTAVLRRR